VPAAGGPVTPRAALWSPLPRGSAAAFHRCFDADALGAARHALVDVDVENDPRADQFIQALGARTVPDDVILRYLARVPAVAPQHLADFYALLGRWVSHLDAEVCKAQLRGKLRRRPLLYTFDGRWVRATEPVFFPRTRALTDIPAGFPGNILHADCTAGRQDAQQVLEDLGVQPFRWREVILTSLLPILRHKPTTGRLRRRIDSFERIFPRSAGGDHEVASQIGIIPVRARLPHAVLGLAPCEQDLLRPRVAGQRQP
jgi:hypothetical protein